MSSRQRADPIERGHDLLGQASRQIPLDPAGPSEAVVTRAPVTSSGDPRSSSRASSAIEEDGEGAELQPQRAHQRQVVADAVQLAAR